MQVTTAGSSISDQLNAKVTVYLPNTDARELTARLDVEMDPIYEMSAREVTGGVGGDYEVIVELSQDLGSGETQGVLLRSQLRSASAR